VLAASAPAVLAILALWMWLHQLGLPHPRDYDEGVYWESLRAMQAGGVLYRDVYDSQPPLFLLSAYPVFEGLGRSLFAARASCVLFSFAGLAGAWLCGRAVAGVRGGAIATLLALTSVAYLGMSQTLQAEAPATGLSWLAAGIAFVARELPMRRRLIAASLAGALLAIAVLCKLLAVAAIVPVVACFALARRDAAASVGASRAALGGCVAGFALAFALGVLPFANDGESMWRQVVLLHGGGGADRAAALLANLTTVAAALATPLGAAAIAGVAVAVRARARIDTLGVVVAWLAATVLALACVVPLFPHHLVVLVPPLATLAAFGALPARADDPREVAIRSGAGAVVALCALLGAFGCATWFTRDRRLDALPDNVAVRAAVHAIDRWIAPGRRVVTDAQFAAALAGRDTPPWLVDTSSARIRAGQLPASGVLAATTTPDVGGVLLFAGRFDALPGLRAAIARRFVLRADLGNGRELRTPRARAEGQPARRP
jgi:hypothetical protein